MHHYAPEGTVESQKGGQGRKGINVLAFLPPGSDNSRVRDLQRSARTRFELEADAVRKYEHDVVGYRAYVQRPEMHGRPPGRIEAREPRRSMA